MADKHVSAAASLCLATSQYFCSESDRIRPSNGGQCFAHLTIRHGWLLRDLLNAAIALVALFLVPVDKALGESLSSTKNVNSPAVHDTGFAITELLPERSFYWLDDDRLLFLGRKATPKPSGEMRKLYIWNTKTKTPQLYTDAEVSAVCFSSGFISYRVHVDRVARTETIREGRFGSEKEVTRNLDVPNSVRSNFTCQIHSRGDLVPPPPRQHLVAVLRKGDGYLDLGPHIGAALDEKDAPTRNLVLHRQTGQAVQLQMTWEERFSPFEIVYSPYRTAYVLVPRQPRGTPIGISGPWPRTQPLRVYLVWADGRTEAISIPYSPSEFLNYPQPLRIGWIFGGGNFYKASGLYLFDGKAVSKLDVGAVRETAGSPDGCKAAVGIQNEHLKMGTPTNLRIFDLCAPTR